MRARTGFLLAALLTQVFATDASASPTAHETELTLAPDDVKQKLLAQGLIAAPSTPEQLTTRIREDYEMLQKLVKTTGIQLN